MLRRVPLVLLLFGCAPDPAADRAAFLAGECTRVGDDALRDDCFVFTVREAPERDTAVCPAVTSPALRDECWFVAIDARELTGDAAVRACERTGRFTSACHANAVSREVSALPPLEEAALTVEVERILRTYRRPPREAAEIVRRRLATQRPRP